MFYVPSFNSLIPMSTWPGTKGKCAVPTRSEATVGESDSRSALKVWKLLHFSFQMIVNFVEILVKTIIENTLQYTYARRSHDRVQPPLVHKQSVPLYYVQRMFAVGLHRQHDELRDPRPHLLLN